MYYIGIDIGGTKIAVGIFDENRNLIKKDKIPTDKSLSAEQLNDGIIALAEKLLQTLGADKKQVGGVGIGCPSTINFETGIVNDTNNIPKLSHFNLKKYWEEHFGCRVIADNDANLAAIAEYRRGAGKGFDNMMYCTVSTGIGGGFILGGKLYRGANGYAGESGHCIVTPHTGPLCGCGNNGCVESYSSGANIARYVAERVKNGETTIMSELAEPEKTDGVILAKAFEAGDAMADEILTQISSGIGLLLFNIYQILNVNCYVLGGGLIKGFGDELINRIKSAFESYKRANPDPVYFKTAALDQDFGIIGACEALF